MMTFTKRGQCVLAMACVTLFGCGNNNDTPKAAVTAPGIEVQTQSSYTQGNQPLSAVLNQVQQNYQTQLQNGQQP